MLFSFLLAAATLSAAPIDVDGGRQLFVDDHLLAATNGVVRHWNAPVKLESPILRPTAPDGTRAGGCTVATDGGLWWDPRIRRFRLWYEDDWAGHLRYAESVDGLAWTFPDLGQVKGTNRVFPDAVEQRDRDLDSWSVWPDYKAPDPYASWKMLVSKPGSLTPDTLYASSDGRVFRALGLAGYSGDRTTLHFDACLGRWVFSLRDYREPYGRARRFHVQDACVPAAVPYGFKYGHVPQPAGTQTPAAWDELDALVAGPRTSVYNFDAVPYESLTLGVIEVLHNTPRDNRDSEDAGLPKQTTLRFAFSRDGRHFTPAPAAALAPSGWGSGKWDTGYLSAMGGICVIKDERLWFYYSALRGDAARRREKVGAQPMFRRGMYLNGAIGAATLRRDGFCGLVADGAGDVVTRPLAFTGARLFVNAECLFGAVAAEILDANGQPVPGFSAVDCRGLEFDDATKREIVFAGGDLAQFARRAVSIRFKLRCATLYSFWISKDASGRSGGYVAAGGPDYPGLRDL